MNAWSYPKLFAHRGGGTLAPENTLAGMKIAANHLYTAVEFDVKLSADGVAFLMHDDMLERTTNGIGAFKDKSAAEIEMLDASGWMTPARPTASRRSAPATARNASAPITSRRGA